MALQKFIFNPGINKEGTDYTAEGGWFDANLVRFRKGLPEKIGGWVKYLTSSIQGKGRKLHAYVTLNGTRIFAIGRPFKLYWQEGDNYNDITPIRSTTSAGDVTFSASDGSSTVTVTDTAHGADLNDFVTFSGAASLGGNITAAVLNQEYQVTAVTSANAFTITAKDTDGVTVTANSSDTGNGGSSTVGAYQISVGLDVFISGTGWSAGAWGSGTWGSTSSLAANNQLRLWSIDNFGEDLIANVRAGGVFFWDFSSSSQRAVALSSIANANQVPTLGLQVLVSDIDRHVIVLGADPMDGSVRSGAIDPLLIAFSDQENPLDFEPRATNTAGSLRCSAGSEIIGGLRARQETLVWTDAALYSLQFIGPPNTFGLTLVNEGVSLIGPNAAINSPTGVYWMDKKGFYTYNGTVQDIPCTVQDYVFSDLNEGQAFQVFGFLNKEFDEVGWFYCAAGETTISKYVVFNYEDGVWSIGELNRTAWIDEGIFDTPIGSYTTSDVGYLYDHETGNDADGSPMDNVYIESSDFALGNGEEFQAINKIIPDIKFTGSGGSGQTVNVVLKQRNYPGESLSTESTNTCTATTTKIDTRLRARQAALRIESDDDGSVGVRSGVGFRVGAMRMDVRPNGRR